MGWNQWGNPGQPYQMNQYRSQMDNSIMCVLVPSAANIDQVTIAPGQKMLVMSQSEPVFAMKTADPMGFVTTKYCTFSEYDPMAAKQKTQTDFEARLSRLEEIVNGQSVNGYAGKFAGEQTEPSV